MATGLNLNAMVVEILAYGNPYLRQVVNSYWYKYLCRADD